MKTDSLSLMSRWKGVFVTTYSTGCYSFTSLKTLSMMRVRVSAHIRLHSMRNNNHKISSSYFGSWLLFGCGSRAAFWYRHHQTNPIITFQFIVCRRDVDSFKRYTGRYDEHFMLQNEVSSHHRHAHFFFCRFCLKWPKKMTLVSHRSYWSSMNLSRSRSFAVWCAAMCMVEIVPVTNNKTP